MTPPQVSADDSYATLARLVARLGQECPWTKAQACQDMLFYTRKVAPCSREHARESMHRRARTAYEHMITF